MDPSLVLLTAILSTTVRSATPLVFAVLGGVFSERSGVINIALEGIMLFSAFMAVVGSHFSGSAWIGVVVGMAGGFVISMILALMTVTFDADQIISGFGINILATGVVGFLMIVIFGVSGNSPLVRAFSTYPVPLLNEIPALGPAVFRQPAIGYLTFVAVPASWWVLYRTPLGLRLRSSGENPAAVDTAGVSVTRMRYIGVGMSGILASLGGAHLSLGLLNQYIEGMTVGRGFIALAIIILAGWDPIRGTVAALLFGFAQAITYQVGQQTIPQEFLFMLPYVLTILVLAGLRQTAAAPAAEGKPYHSD